MPPALFAVFVWWVGTGAILYLDGLPRGHFWAIVTGATGLTVFALWSLARSCHDTSAAGAYIAFTCSVVVWGWNELIFLMGYLTGPRKLPCPPEVRGWRRFWYATLTVIHHELALLVTLLLVVGLTHGGANQVGTWTFMVLWLMRLSAKFNVFLGVRNLTEEFIPDHLRYLLSHVRRAPWNPLMPLSLLVSVSVLCWLGSRTLAPGASDFTVASGSLLATLLALAVLEHVFLVVPVPDAVLWRWALGSRHRAR